MPGQEEMLAILDPQGNVIGSLPSSEARKEPRIHWCGVADVIVVNRRGEILCSKRSAIVKHDPEKWQVRFGGHMKAGHSVMDTAISELYEEAGLRLVPEELGFLLKGSSELRMRHYEYFAYLFKDTDHVAFTDGEIEEVRWMFISEILESAAANPENWRHSITEEVLMPLNAWAASKGVTLAKKA